MTSKAYVLETLRRAGLREAREIREKAVAGALDGTELIAEEGYIPDYPADGNRDFTAIPVGAPYRYDGQVYKLWQQHDANGNPDWTPDRAASLWDVCHTTDPARAKPYQLPQGSRGLYQTGECMVWTDGKVWRSKVDNNAYTPEELPDNWEVMST